MRSKSTSRRPRGTGSLISRVDGAGHTTYYGKFWVGGRQVMRKLGIARAPGSTLGLTRAQAEAALRRLMDAELAAPQLEERIDVFEAGERYLQHLGALGRKRSTLEDYRSTLGVHLVPFFAGKTLDAIDARVVEAFVRAKLREG